MYELIQVSESCFYIESPAKIGLIKLTDSDVCLIDSGNDESAGRKVKKILDANGWRLTAIYNTHSNADHIGGNKYLQSQTGCRIFAAGIEKAFTRYPVLEPSFLYGGFPFKELRRKFLMAEPSVVEDLMPESLPDSMQAVDLKGHFFDMTGFKTAEGVFYLADCLSSKAVLDKYRITFIYDVSEYLNTLERVKKSDAKVFIPSHAEVTDDISDLVSYNIEAVYGVADLILDLLKSPLTFEKLLQALFETYGLMMNAEQYVLAGSTVRSYLSWLSDSQRICFEFKDNEMFWRRTERRL